MKNKKFSPIPVSIDDIKASRRGFVTGGLLGGGVALASILIGPTMATAKEINYSTKSFKVYNRKFLTWSTSQDSLSQVSSVSFNFSPKNPVNVYARATARKAGDSYYSALIYYQGTRTRLYLEKKNPNGKVELFKVKDIPAIYNPRLEISVRGDNYAEIKVRAYSNNLPLKGIDEDWDLTYRDTTNLLKGSETGYSFWVSRLNDGDYIDVNNLEYKFKDYSVEEIENTSPEFKKLVFEDNFTGSSINTSLWTVRDNDYVGYDSGYIVKENAYIKNNNLYMDITKRDTPIVKRDGKVREYNTSALTTVGKFSQVYGRWEFRAKIPAQRDISAGIWCGLWLRTDNKSIEGEVDIAESFGSYNPLAKTTQDMSNKVTTSVHFKQTGSDKKAKVMPDIGAVLDEEYHIWTFERTPERFTFLLDGKKYFEVLTKDYPDKFKTAFPDNEPLHIRLNVQATSPGTYWGGINENTVLPRSMIVDYVKAWAYTP